MNVENKDILSVPQKYWQQVETLIALLDSGEISCISELRKKNGDYLVLDLSELEQHQNRVGVDRDPDLDELWAKVLPYVDSPTTRAILKQQARLAGFNFNLLDLAEIEFTSEKIRDFTIKKIDCIKAAFKKYLGVDVEVEFLFQGQPPKIEDEDSLPAISFTPFPKPKSLDLTEDQTQALEKLKEFTRSSSEPMFRLIGYAGTGKSFLICEYIKWLYQNRISLLAACPTNKAAKNLRQIAKEAGLDLEVKTVSQLLGQQPELNEETGKEDFASVGENCIGEYRIIIIDEFSMVNRENFTEIRDEARTYGTKIIFVGDAAQLPPVKELEPMAAKHPMNEARLNKIVRYDGDIVRIAEAIRSNPVIPAFTTTADKSVICLNQKEWLSRAFELFESEEFSANADYVRVIAWRNKTVKALNNAVRLHLWGELALPFVPGDRLIALKPLFRPKPGAKGKNKWKVFINNSEEAIVTQEGVLRELTFNREQYRYWEVLIRPDLGQEQKLMILHEDSVELQTEKVKHYAKQKQWSSYFDLSRMFDNVGYAYALTCHKAQGSSIEHVFLDAEDMHKSSDRQKLLYTALTRTKKQAFVLN